MKNEDRKKPFVRFYDVNDVPVCVWCDGNEVMGFVVTSGYPYAPLKASAEGKEIDTDELASIVKRGCGSNTTMY